MCSVACFTQTEMDVYQARAALLAASPSNAASLEEIESAILVVALDDTKPVTREQISWACWVGDGKNRFYDKHQCKHEDFSSFSVHVMKPTSPRSCCL